MATKVETLPGTDAWVYSVDIESSRTRCNKQAAYNNIGCA
jgi:hypothetical protein